MTHIDSDTKTHNYRAHDKIDSKVNVVTVPPAEKAGIGNKSELITELKT